MKTKKQLQEFMDSIVFCEECGVAIKKNKAHKVISRRINGWITGEDELFYCDRHSTKYDIVIIGTGYKVYYKSIKAQEIRVNEKGKSINN